MICHRKQPDTSGQKITHTDLQNRTAGRGEFPSHAPLGRCLLCGALGLTEERKAEGDHGSADEQGNQGVRSHQRPNRADAGLQRITCGSDQTGDGDGGLGLKPSLLSYGFLVAGDGFEPPASASGADMLPLHYPTIFVTHSGNSSNRPLPGICVTHFQFRQTFLRPAGTAPHNDAASPASHTWDCWRQAVSRSCRRTRRCHTSGYRRR